MVLATGAMLSGCSVVGVVTGGVLGAALGGSDGAAAGAELGLYMGLSVDAAILDSLSYPSPEYDNDHGVHEWYADEYYEDDCDEAETVYVPPNHDGGP